jgi:NAD(P) transhydrogenase subunit alpha
MYARNVVNLVSQIVKDGKITIDTSDELIRGALVTHQGQITHEIAKSAMSQPPAPALAAG